MKTTDIFEQYIDDDELDFEFETKGVSITDRDFSDMSFAEVDKLMFNPSHTTIGMEEMVNIIKDTQLIWYGKWEDAVMWINVNWDSLNGKYDVSQKGAVIYSLTVSH